MDRLPRPVLRSLIVCDRVEANPQNHKRLNVYGIITNLRMTKYPGLNEDLHVLALLSECRGEGAGHVEIVHANTEVKVFQTAETSIRFGSDPLAVHGVLTRIKHCGFEEPGLFWVRFIYNNEILGETPIVLK